MSAIYLIRFGETRIAVASSGLLLAGALLTKQVTLIVAPLVLLLPVVRLGKRGILATVAFVVATLTAVAILESLNKGWFLYYTFHVLTHTETVWRSSLTDFWTRDLLRAFPIATVLGLGWCFVAWRVASRHEAAFYTICGAALIAAAWETRLHPGALRNTVLPAYLFLAMASTRAAGWWEMRAPGMGSTLLIAQLALLFYSPQVLVPSRSDRDAAEVLLGKLRSVRGEVLMLDHGYFATLAGKRTHAHELAIRDVLSVRDEWTAALRTEFRHALETERFDLIVQDTPDWFPVPLPRYYRRLGIA